MAPDNAHAVGDADPHGFGTTRAPGNHNRRGRPTSGASPGGFSLVETAPWQCRADSSAVIGAGLHHDCVCCFGVGWDRSTVGNVGQAALRCRCCSRRSAGECGGANERFGIDTAGLRTAWPTGTTEFSAPTRGSRRLCDHRSPKAADTGNQKLEEVRKGPMTQPVKVTVTYPLTCCDAFSAPSGCHRSLLGTFTHDQPDGDVE